MHLAAAAVIGGLATLIFISGSGILDAPQQSLGSAAFRDAPISAPSDPAIELETDMRQALPGGTNLLLRPHREMRWRP
jgi:hypothetical protein